MRGIGILLGNQHVGFCSSHYWRLIQNQISQSSPHSQRCRWLQSIPQCAGGSIKHTKEKGKQDENQMRTIQR